MQRVPREIRMVTGTQNTTGWARYHGSHLSGSSSPSGHRRDILCVVLLWHVQTDAIHFKIVWLVLFFIVPFASHPFDISQLLCFLFLLFSLTLGRMGVDGLRECVYRAGINV